MALASFPRELLIRQARAQEVVSLRSVLVFLVFGGLLSLSYPGRHGLNRVRWSRVHLPLLGRGPIIADRCVVGVGACSPIGLPPICCALIPPGGISIPMPPIGMPPICCELIPPGGIPILMPVGTRIGLPPICCELIPSGIPMPASSECARLVGDRTVGTPRPRMTAAAAKAGMGMTEKASCCFVSSFCL
ncbi:hypothetical protein T492DRAFT_1004445 [Pavlovales sp. CCMP2436]|nr:hypothetical protein T492DRAFT_1004445 [Pavlovales sp. CCMP2436]